MSASRGAQPVGILHPGEMGSAVAATIRNSGYSVLWISEGRSHLTRARAESAGFTDAGTLTHLCERCAVIVSVCPPEFAADLAGQVAAQGFRGVYLDANAIAPAHKRELGERLQGSGIRFVDGGIIGLPPKKRGETWLYLSGEHAESIVCCFQAGPLEVEVIGAEIGKASALKMCYAAQNKGSIALLLAVLGAADRMGVLEDLKRDWTRHASPLEKGEARILRAAPKAWRWSPEMQEIAATLETSGMPAGFHQAAAEIYEMLRGFKDSAPGSLEDVLLKLRAS